MQSEKIIAGWERRIALRQRNPATSAVDVGGIQPQEHHASSLKNVGVGERLVSLAGGTALAIAGRHKANTGGILLALLGAGLVYRGATGHCLCYQALGISTTSQHRNTAIPAKQGVKVQKTITIRRPASELYEFWRNLTNLPRVFQHLQSVEQQDGNCSHWIATEPAGLTVQWDAEVLNDHENKMIAWRSLPGSQVETAGSVHFKPTNDPHGTHVTVSMKYNPPGGQLGDKIASWFGSGLEATLDSDLRNFKSLMETGEIPSTSGQPRGKG